MSHIKNEAMTKCHLSGDVDLELSIWKALWKEVGQEVGLVGCIFIT